MTFNEHGYVTGYDIELVEFPTPAQPAFVLPDTPDGVDHALWSVASRYAQGWYPYRLRWQWQWRHQDYDYSTFPWAGPVVMTADEVAVLGRLGHDTSMFGSIPSTT